MPPRRILYFGVFNVDPLTLLPPSEDETPSLILREFSTAHWQSKERHFMAYNPGDSCAVCTRNKHYCYGFLFSPCETCIRKKVTCSVKNIYDALGRKDVPPRQVPTPNILVNASEFPELANHFACFPDTWDLRKIRLNLHILTLQPPDLLKTPMPRKIRKSLRAPPPSEVDTNEDSEPSEEEPEKTDSDEEDHEKSASDEEEQEESESGEEEQTESDEEEHNDSDSSDEDIYESGPGEEDLDEPLPLFYSTRSQSKSPTPRAGPSNSGSTLASSSRPSRRSHSRSSPGSEDQPSPAKKPRLARPTVSSPASRTASPQDEDAVHAIPPADLGFGPPDPSFFTASSPRKRYLHDYRTTITSEGNQTAGGEATVPQPEHLFDDEAPPLQPLLPLIRHSFSPSTSIIPTAAEDPPVVATFVPQLIFDNTPLNATTFANMGPNGSIQVLYQLLQQRPLVTSTHPREMVHHLLNISELLLRSSGSAEDRDSLRRLNEALFPGGNS